MNSAFGKIAVGQILLIICCIFYLIWWSISYRPGVEVNRAGGLNGILLMITEAISMAAVLLVIRGPREACFVGRGGAAERILQSAVFQAGCEGVKLATTRLLI
ncbi:MAG: hypothetical protein DUD27_09585 [Lachnospiraceae bacterium]|nr:MAG: hypothetical protein DUD27_09585 [Lachnospiraceae bacterium]